MDGREPGPVALTAQVVAIGPRYFQTLGLPMISGRGLDEVEAPARTSSALVNERFVARFSPDADPIGRGMTIVNDRAPGSPPLRVRIVGIAPPLRQALNVAGSPVVYVAHAAESSAAASIVIRGHPDRFAELLRQEVRELNPDLPLFRLQSLERASYLSRWIPRATSTAFSATAIVATLLSALGIYSITALAASQRTREIGVRMALGASPGSISRLFLGRILGPLSIGVVLGLAGAVGAGRALQGLLVDVRANDPMVLAGVSALLVVVAIVAGLRPARRAARLDPATTLRAD
jgi:putative ABC transport system permease protein